MAVIELRKRIPVPITTDFIADNSITTSKIADNSITTEKIVDNAITLSKVSGSVRAGFVIGDDTLMYSYSTTGEEIKRFSFVKSQTIEAGGKGKNWKKVYWRAELRTTDTTGMTTATIYMLINNETTPRTGASASTNSSTFDIVDGAIDISDLPFGKHDIHIYIKTSNGTYKVEQQTIEFVFEEQL